MKTGDVARMLNVTRKTIANWTMAKEIQPYLSEGALRIDESAGNPEATTAQRDFNERDVYVLNTIRIHKTRTNTWSDVARLLESGKLEMTLPASALLVETMSPVQQMESLMLAQQELEIANAKIRDLEAQLHNANSKVTEMSDKLREEYIHLHRKIAVLEYQLEQLKLESGDG